MNPRGRQYALGGTLQGWARLREPTRRQRFVLRSTYGGWDPLGYSKYGHRQLAGLLPWSRIIVKDPFAVLSIPAVVRVTRAVPILIYRHPGAMLDSYRRMGWSPDLDELGPIVDRHNASVEPGLRMAPPPRPDEVSEVEAMASFWNILYGLALQDVEAEAGLGVHVVSHREVSLGGESSVRRLFSRLGLQFGGTTADNLAGGADQVAKHGPGAGLPLHRFGRDPKVVAESWRGRVPPGETEALEYLTHVIWERLEGARSEL